jgi:hypothetical protein
LGFTGKQQNFKNRCQWLIWRRRVSFTTLGFGSIAVFFFLAVGEFLWMEKHWHNSIPLTTLQRVDIPPKDSCKFCSTDVILLFLERSFCCLLEFSKGPFDPCEYLIGLSFCSLAIYHLEVTRNDLRTQIAKQVSVVLLIFLCRIFEAQCVRFIWFVAWCPP